MEPGFDLKKELLRGLPAYTEGRMSDFVYDAGEGIAAGLDDGRILRSELNLGNEEFEKYMEQLVLSGYAVTERKAERRQVTVALSKGKTKVSAVKEGTAVLVRALDAEEEKPEKPVLVRTVTQTTAESFEAYLRLLESIGCKRIWQNRIEDNLYRELLWENHLIYAYFMGKTGTARFADDRVSARIDEFGGGSPLPGNKTALCQFGLHYGRMVPGVSADCGMFYIIRLPDNSVFLIDGGEYEQATEAAVSEVMRVMCLLTGMPDGAKIRIAGWFCTHAHDDHLDLFGKLLRFHHDKLEVERVIFNFPSRENYDNMLQAYVVLDRLKRYYPHVRYLKPHSGQSFLLAGVTFEFLQTHEDSTGPLGNELIGGFNDTCTILKISFDGVSFMVLGDMDLSSEALILRHYSEKALRSTAVQAAHHLINVLEFAYPAVAPKLALVPQNISFGVPKDKRYKVLCRSVAEKNIYFASLGTDVFEEKNGELMLTAHYPPVGGEYDGSET